MTNLHAAAQVLVMALVTALIRFAPFLVMRGKTDIPPLLLYLGRVLPCAIMGMLIVYCLKDVSFLHAPFGAPELLGIALTAGLHLWKRSTLLSILGGTIGYMLLVQLVF